MSSEEFEFEEDEIEFEYESEGGNESDEGSDEETIAIENLFYEADDVKLTQPSLAIERFQKVVELENQRKEQGYDPSWRRIFLSLRNISMLSASLGNMEGMEESYTQLLKLTDKVTRNEAADAIDFILESIPSSTSTDNDSSSSTLEKIFTLTLETLRGIPTLRRLWFSTTLKLARLYLHRHEYAKTDQLLTELKEQKEDTNGIEVEGNASHLLAGAHLLEVYAVEIHLCSATKDFRRLKNIWHRLQLSSSIADPRTVAIIRDSGGKMLMEEKKWDKAYQEFLEAFKCYQEAGHSREAKRMLKYVVLASMLSKSTINPFDSREAKVYQDDPEIRVMQTLRNAYDQKDMSTIREVLANPNYNLADDPFMKSHIDDLLCNIRLGAMRELLSAYSSIHLEKLSESFRLSVNEVICHIVKLSLDSEDQIYSIDEVKGIVTVRSRGDESSSTGSGNEHRFESLISWALSLQTFLAQTEQKFSLPLATPAGGTSRLMQSEW